MTYLCVSIMVHSTQQALARAAVAAEQGAQMVELRLDHMADDPTAAVELVGQCPLPCIVTCRPVWEGGEYEGEEDARAALFEHIGPARPAYVDVELTAWRRGDALQQAVRRIIDHPQQPSPTTTGLILSTHDFEQRPSDLLQRVEEMARLPECRVIKTAWRARSLRDNLEAFELPRAGHKPSIALCMGRFGLPSRILAKKFGALLTFASADAQSATAPGQVSVHELKNLYRWDAINEHTAVLGVIGWPVAHSRSPQIHNAGFGEIGYNGVYLPMPIPPEYEHLKATLSAWLDAKPLHFRGASVTIPHKQNLIRFVTEAGGEVEPLARAIGAANTLSVGEDGSLYACNTDYAAALDAVCDAVGIERQELAGQSVAVIGAGGVARAAVAGFVHYGAQVVIYNRTFERARDLADQLGGEEMEGNAVAAPLDELRDSRHRIYINCTPVGMHPDVEATPVPEPPACWGEGTLVFDTIYSPPQTRLLREARDRGCTTVSGEQMFLRQAAAQFQLWTDQPAPMQKFREVMG